MKPILPRLTIEQIVDTLVLGLNDEDLTVQLLTPGPAREAVAQVLGRATSLEATNGTLTITWTFGMQG